MKVLVVMESWGLGGTETYVAGLLRYLRGEGVDVVLALFEGGTPPAMDCLPSDNVRAMPPLTGLARTIRREAPDVVNLHLYARLLPAAVACALARVPVVTTMHMPLHAWGWRHRLYWRVALRLSTIVVGVSHAVLSCVRTRATHERPLPGAVASVFFGERRARSLPRQFAVAAVGRLSREKDWPTLLQAVSLLPAPARDLVVVDFFGDGPLLASLKELATRLKVRATFHGHVNQEALADALNNADLSVLPSRFEGLGLAALESMASGVPTVTSDFPAAREFIRDGATGRLFPAGDADALSRIIEWHITNPSAGEALGSAGREFVRSHYSESVAYRPYLDLFQRAAT